MATKTENDEGGIKGLQELTAMLSAHLQLMQDQDSYVESAISMCEKATQTLLRKAKERSLSDEKKLLQSLGVLQLGTFLRDTVLVERMYDEMYEPLREEQKMARSLYAPKLEEYEKKLKPVTQGGSIVSLMFSAQNLYLPAFQQFVNQLKKKCDQSGITVKKVSKVVVKNVERTFYKTYYVYRGDHTQLTDLLRCSFVFDSFTDLYKAFSVLEELAVKNDDVKGILRAKDRFTPANVPFGYRDLLVNVYCPGTDLVCEVQFHHNVFYQYKKESHYVYKRARLFESGDRNLAYEYVTKYIKDKVSKNEKYTPHADIDHDHAEENNEKEEGKETEGHSKDGDKKTEEKTVEELMKEWMPQQVAKQYCDALAEHGYDTCEMLEMIANTEEETLSELTKTMGFKVGHAKLFIKRRDEYFRSLRDKENHKIHEKEQLKQNWNDKIQKDKESAMAAELAKKTKEFESAYNRFLVATAFIAGQTQKTWKCTWFGKNPYRWINSDWEAAPLSTQGPGLPERIELEDMTLKVFSIICQYRVSKCREGAHHSSFISFENYTLVKGDDFYEFDTVDNKFHNLVISVDLNKNKVCFMVDNKTKSKEFQINIAGGIINPHVVYIGCHIHRGFGNVYKRMDGEIANVRIYSIPFDTALMETAMEFYKAVKPATQ